MRTTLLLLALVTAAVAGAAWLVPFSDARGVDEAVPRLYDDAPLGDLPSEPELGKVHWLRNLDSALVEAKRRCKPVLILFQEVPGCSNCTRYGGVTLSHPLIVEAIEDQFVPLCIFNNKGGADRAALDRFGEPAWNNPVVRIVSADGKGLVPRMADFGSSWQVVNGMRQALEGNGQSAPRYLSLLEEELLARERGTETATFTMYCFWSGEGTLGAVPGVVETEPGFQDGREVVKVVFDPQVVQKSRLEELAQPKGIAACSKNDGFRSDREPKYYLAQTNWRFVPMTATQACRANALVGQGQSPAGVLSPRQVALFEKINATPNQRRPNAIGTPNLAKAWDAATAAR